MPTSPGAIARVAVLFGFSLLAGCASNTTPPMAAAVPYNPPPVALTTAPANEVVWYHVNFATGSSTIDAEGREVVDRAAGLMSTSPMLLATVVGRTDPVGTDAENMRLSRNRALAVRRALLATGKVTAKRIETRWTGMRRQGDLVPPDMADASSRAADIGLH